jgi:hypothetical protein
MTPHSLGKLALPLLALLGLVLAVSLILVVRNARRRLPLHRPLLVALGATALALAVHTVHTRYQGTERCLDQVRHLAAALELYGQVNGGQYPPDLGRLVPSYFEELPTCPVAAARDPSGENTYLRGYQVAPGNFTVSCAGDWHQGPGGAPPGYPLYSARQGLVRNP